MKHRLNTFFFIILTVISPAKMGLTAQVMNHAQMQQGVTRTVAEYKVPDITLINQDGQQVRLPEYLDTEKFVVLEFIFATCTTICPILTANFTSLQTELNTDINNVRMVSISIDPEHDTPAILKRYLEKFNAQPGWDFLTGRLEDITQIMKAFNAHVSDKMGHRPLIFLHAPGQKKWVRLDGLMSGETLKKEYLKLKK